MPQQQDSAQLATARKQKKRELDRKAQRVARERTKNRIAHLEGLVEHLQASNPNAEVSDLTAALTRVTEERDALAGALRSIEHTVQTTAQLRGLSSSSSRVRPPFPPESPSVQAQFPLDVLPPNLVSSQAYSHAPGSSSTTSPPHPHYLAGPTSHLPAINPNRGQIQSSHAPDGADILPFNHTCGQEWEDANSCDEAKSADVIVPTPEWPCDCMQMELDRQVKNTWRAANTALGKSTRLSPSQLAIEDFTSHDTPVRVVLDGWDSVENAGKMSQSWRKLRTIDETCFASCGDTERLAILTTMHLIITYHGEPSRERRDKLPRWLWTRPSQTIPHSYAIDFFVWPGLRERFIFAQHRYCTNLFWQLFQQALRILWPHDLTECYSKDADTGRYLLSTSFQNRIRDINAWQMTGDFLSEFPELHGDIPTFGSIPASIDSAEVEKEDQSQAASSKDVMVPLSLTSLMPTPPTWGNLLGATKHPSDGQLDAEMLYGIDPDWGQLL